MRKLNQQGVTIALAAVIAFVMGSVVLGIAKLADLNARQSVYFNSMNNAYQLAETGLNDAIAQLTKTVDLTSFNTNPVLVPDQHGSYQNWTAPRTVPVGTLYYVVTSATRSISGQAQTVASTRLHSYVRVSNVGSYFAAVNSKLTISRGVNIREGKVYAPSIEFLSYPGGGATTVLTVDYDGKMEPPISPGPSTDTRDDTWPNVNFVNIVDKQGNPNNAPHKLDQPPLFPQVFASDLLSYKNKAGRHTTKSVFIDKIYPPGYANYGGASPDGYNHSNNNEEHIYYFAGDMFIRGEVFGQILFVAEGDIHITGELFKSLSNVNSLSDPSLLLASKAHEAVLVTQGTVYIEPTFVESILGGGMFNTRSIGDSKTQRVQALIMAPNAALMPLSYDKDWPGNSTEIHEALSFDFKGSMILGRIPSEGANCLLNVFRNGRTYAYDTDFKNFPPPYLPAVVEIHYMFEETTSQSGLYN